MKHLGEICTAVVLTCMLTAISFGGEMNIPIASPSEPPVTSNTGTQATADPVTEIALNLLQSIGLLF